MEFTYIVINHNITARNRGKVGYVWNFMVEALKAEVKISLIKYEKEL